MKAKEFVQMGMSVKNLPLNSEPAAKIAFPVPDGVPATVREPAIFLGVNPQTAYLWIERKRIPDLCVIRRNIHFLQSELESFRRDVSQGAARLATYSRRVGIVDTIQLALQ